MVESEFDWIQAYYLEIQKEERGEHFPGKGVREGESQGCTVNRGSA